MFLKNLCLEIGRVPHPLCGGVVTIHPYDSLFCALIDSLFSPCLFILLSLKIPPICSPMIY